MALAQVFGPDGTVCPPEVYGYGVLSRMVHCIKWTMLGSPNGMIPGALSSFLLPLSVTLSYAVAAACTLAVIFMGLRVAVFSSQRLSGDLVVTGVKIVLVAIYSFNFGGMFPSILGIADDLMNAVSQYIPFTGVNPMCAYDVWANMDCLLDKLIGGILPGSSLLSGALGFLVGALFSGPVGLSVALLGGWMLLFLLNAMFKAVYTYLSAVIGLMFMALVSPIMIPCMLFQVTHSYFEKWLRLFIGLIIQPAFLAAYVSILVVAFQYTIFSGPYSLYYAIAGGNVQEADFRIGNYMAESGAYGEGRAFTMGVMFNPAEQQYWLQQSQGRNTGAFGTQSMMSMAPDQYSQHVQGFGTSPTAADTYFTVRAVSMERLAQLRGSDTMAYVVNIMLALLHSAVMAYIFYTMQDVVPYLAASLSGGVAGGAVGLPDLAGGYDKMTSNFERRLRLRQEADERTGERQRRRPA